MPRKKIPTPMKVLRGNPGKRIEDIETQEPEPELVEAGVESPIALDEWERSKWDRIVENLQSVKMLAVCDLDTLARYVVLLRKWDQARDRTEKDGMYVTKHNQYDEYEAVAPWFIQMQKLSDQLMRMEREFGFTPSSRSSLIGPIKGETQDEWEEYLFGKLRKRA